MTAAPTTAETADQIYQALMPLLSGKPIDQTSMALVTHLAVMVDQVHPGMGDARKASQSIGEQIWSTVIDMRNARHQARGTGQ